MTIVRSAIKSGAQLALFLAIGCTSGLAYFMAIYILVDLGGLNYLVGVSIGYLAALASHFFMNKTLLFGRGAKVSTRHLFRYLQLCILNYSLTLVSVFLAVEYVNTSHHLAVLCALLLTTPIGFLAMKVYVFNKQ